MIHNGTKPRHSEQDELTDEERREIRKRNAEFGPSLAVATVEAITGRGAEAGLTDTEIRICREVIQQNAENVAGAIVELVRAEKIERVTH